MTLTYREFLQRAASVVVLVGLAVTIAFGAYQLSSILLIALFCWVLAVSLEVPINYLESMGLQRGLAITLVLLGVVIIFTLIGLTIVPPLLTQGEALIEGLPETIEQAILNYDQLRESSNLFSQVLPAFTPEDYRNLLGGTLDLSQFEAAEGANGLNNLLTGQALPLLGNIGTFVGNLVANLLLIIFLTIFFLLDPIDYYRGLISLVPQGSEARAIDVLNQVRRVIRTWLGVLLSSILFTGGMVALTLGLILGIPNAIALGVLAGFASIVPTIGPTLALIPILIITAAAEPARLIPALIFYLVIGITQDRVIAPTIVKNQLDIPPALLLLFQVIAGLLFGFLGILLAVPLLGILLVLIREMFVFNFLGKQPEDIPDVTETRERQLRLLPPQNTTSQQLQAEAGPSSSDLPDVL